MNRDLLRFAMELQALLQIGEIDTDFAEKLLESFENYNKIKGVQK